MAAILRDEALPDTAGRGVSHPAGRRYAEPETGPLSGASISGIPSVPVDERLQMVREPSSTTRLCGQGLSLPLFPRPTPHFGTRIATQNKPSRDDLSASVWARSCLANKTRLFARASPGQGCCLSGSSGPTTSCAVRSPLLPLARGSVRSAPCSRGVLVCWPSDCLSTPYQEGSHFRRSPFVYRVLLLAPTPVRLILRFRCVPVPRRTWTVLRGVR